MSQLRSTFAVLFYYLTAKEKEQALNHLMPLHYKLIWKPTINWMTTEIVG